jgi:HK97 family phage portal protein
VGILRYLRGTDLLEDKSTNGRHEDRAIKPGPGEVNEIPLYGLPAVWSGTDYWNLRPVEALAIADVWSAVRVLADAVSSLPLHVYRKTEQGRAQVASGRLVELLERPSPGVTEADLTSTLITHLAIWGNAFLAKYRQQGEVTQLGLLHPERVRPEIVNGELRFRYDPPRGPQQLLSESDVVHVKWLSVDGVSGLSAVSQAARVLGPSDSLVKHALAFCQTDTPRPMGVLRFGHGEEQEGGDLETKRKTEQFKNEAKAHGILVVQGDAEYQQIAQKLDDAQFTEQRRLAAQEIARVFRIPSHMLNAGSGGDSLTYSTVEQQSLDFARYSLAPWLRRMELAISSDRDLAFQRQFVKFEIDALLRPDSAGRAAFYAAAFDPVVGWMDRSEVRRLEDLPPESTPPTRQQTVEQMLARPQGVASNGSS